MCWERLKTQSEGLVPTSDITIISHKLKHNVVMSLLSQWERLKPVLLERLWSTYDFIVSVIIIMSSLIIVETCKPLRHNHNHNNVRLLAVPFWIVERAREIAERKTGASFPPLVRSSFFVDYPALGYFARLLDYPERDC